jgi:hypothetical protein
MLNEKFIYMSIIFSAVEVQLSPKSSLVFLSLLPVPTPPNATKGNETKIHFRCKSNVSYAVTEENINPTKIAQINSN